MLCEITIFWWWWWWWGFDYNSLQGHVLLSFLYSFTKLPTTVCKVRWLWIHRRDGRVIMSNTCSAFKLHAQSQHIYLFGYIKIIWFVAVRAKEHIRAPTDDRAAWVAQIQAALGTGTDGVIGTPGALQQRSPGTYCLFLSRWFVFCA